MKFVNLLITVLSCIQLVTAQTNLGYNNPVYFSDANNATSIDPLAGSNTLYNILINNDIDYGVRPISVGEDCCDYSPGTPTFFANSAPSDAAYVESPVTNLESYSFFSLGNSGTSTNSDLSVTKKDEGGTVVWSVDLPQPTDDFGLKTIGTEDGGAFTVAVREDLASGFYQLRLIKHTATTGAIEWETYIPIADTGYDDIFMGVDANGDFIEEIQLVPVITQVKQVPDGYVIFNADKKYFPPGTSYQYTSIIKLDQNGNFLWRRRTPIQLRESLIAGPVSNDYVSSVEGTADGSTYFTITNNRNVNSDAQYRRLDSSGSMVDSVYFSWILDDNKSYLIKEIDNKIYWVVRTESGPFTGESALEEFLILDITDPANRELVATLPNISGSDLIPKDLIQLPNGDFLVTGEKEVIGFPPVASEVFVVRLQNLLDNDSGFPDLNLSVSADNPNTEIYEYITLTYTLTNTGAVAATGVDLAIERNAGSTQSGEIPSVTSQGQFSLGYLESALWEVGTLAAGESATLDITYFTLSDDPIFYGQVTAMNETDADSAPNNGTFAQENEDDEAAFQITPPNASISGTVFFDTFREGGVNCQNGNCTFLEGIEINLLTFPGNVPVATAVTNSQGQFIFPNLPYDFYKIEYNPSGDLIMTPNTLGSDAFDFTNDFGFLPSEPGYGFATIPLFPLNGDVIQDLGLVSLNDCTLDELFAESECDDNGTPQVTSDDMVTLRFRADGLGRADYTIQNASGQLTSGSFFYGNGFITAGPYSIDELPATLTVTNIGTFSSLNCSETYEFTLANTCNDNPPNLPDIQVINSGPTDILQLETGQQNVILPAMNIINTGNIATPAGVLIPLKIYLSDDPIFGNADDILVESVQYQQLPVGQFNAVVGFDIPSDIAPGDYRIFVNGDDGNAVAESNENNNLDFRNATISQGSTGGDCSIQLQTFNTSTCNNNGTPTIATDDFFTFSFTPTVVDGSSQFIIDQPFITTNGTVGTTTSTLNNGTLISFSANILEAQAAFGNDNVVFSIRDVNDASCTMNVVTFVPDVCSLSGNGDVDLELSATSNAPAIYQNGQATFTLENKGTEEATGVIVEFNKNETLSITAFPTVSQGQPQQHWTDTPKWQVGNLAPGQSATITFAIFTLSDNLNFYAQVTDQNENDTDSTPNNGNGTSPVEDDEASFPSNDAPPTPCTSLNAQVVNIKCQNNGTGSNPNDDTFTFDVIVSSNSSECSIYNISGGTWTTQGSLGSTLSSPQFSIAAGSVDFTATLPNNPSISTTFTVNPPSTCSNGTTNLPDLTVSDLTIEGTGTAGQISNYSVQVSNQGTANTSGDYVIGAYLSSNTTLDASDELIGVINTGNTPIGNEPLTPGSVTVPAGTPAGNYFLILETDTNQEITESNEANNRTFAPFTVSNGNTGGGADLVVNIQTASTVVGQYINFSVNYNLANTGDSPATDVQVFVPKPDGVVYVGGNEFDADQGTFEVFGNNIWNVGTVNAGDNLTLTINYFTLNAGQLTLWQEVAAMNENDADSTPGNGTPFQSFSEDDEARIFVTVGNNLIGGNDPITAHSDLALGARLFPVPTYDNLTVEVFTTEEIETQLALMDANGRMLETRSLAPQKGAQQVQLSLQNTAPGIYFVRILQADEVLTYRFVRL